MDRTIQTSSKRSLSRRLAIGGAIAATTAVIGIAGVAGAAPTTSSAASDASIVAMCKKDYKKLGFKNVGQCVSEMKKHHGQGNGYGNGNGNTVNTQINLDVSGNNNVISFVINMIFG